MSSSQLENLTFINTASLPYASVDVDGNTLFAGRNGAGKTTILRAVLYFYGAFRREELGISIKKKRFEEYYFAVSNAYLIYTFSNRYSKVLTFVYKLGGTRLKYRFAKVPEGFDLDTLKELIFVEHQAKEPKELFNTLIGAGFELSPILNSAKEYKNVLYGQDRGLIAYSFYQANASYDQIAKTISNIFINSKLDSGSIKKSLASTVTGFEKIDLAQIEQKIDLFSVQHDDIKSFEKNLPTIHEALESLTRLTLQKESLSQKLLQLQANSSVIETQSVEIKEELETLRSDFEKEKTGFEQEQEAHIASRQELSNQIAVLKAQIKESHDKQAYYEAQDIEAKKAAFDAKPNLLANRQNLEAQKTILTKEYEDVTKQFEALDREEAHAFQTQKQQLQFERNRLQTLFNEAQAKEQQSFMEAIEAFETGKIAEKSTVEAQLSQAKEAKQQAHFELQNARQKNYLYEELHAASEALNFSQEKLNQEKQNSFAKKKELELIYEKKSALEAQVSRDKELTQERYVQEKRGLDQALQGVQAKLTHLQKSVAGFLESQSASNKALLQTILKDEVLFATDLSPELSEGDTLLGLALDFEKIELKPIVLQELEAERSRLETTLDQIKTAFDNRIQELEADHKQKIKTHQKNESLLREAVTKSDLDIQKLERAFLEAKESLIALQAQKEQRKNEALQKAQALFETAQTTLDQAQKAYDAYMAQQGEEKAQIKRRYEEKKAALAGEFALDQEVNQKALDVAEESYEATMQARKKSMHDALSQQGVDATLLDKLDQEIAQTAKELERIESFSELIQSYAVHKKELFDTLKDKEEALNKCKKSYDDQSFAFVERKKVFESVQEIFEKAKDQLSKKRSRFQAELGAFRRFQESELYTEFVRFNTQSIEANSETLEALIFSIKDLESAQSKSLRDLQKHLQKVFNNISEHSAFNIERPIDDSDEAMITSARALQSFIEEGKLQTFKDEVSRLYHATFHFISKDVTELLKADSEIKKVVSQINKTLSDLQGIKVIENVELKFKPSDNALLNALKYIVELSETISVYEPDTLFGASGTKREHHEMLKALDQLSRELHSDKRDYLSVDDSFVLEFRAIENGHDTGFVPSLDGIGSNGTDVMVKAMVYIAMLSLARKQSNKQEDDVYFHCILDEVGILAPNYLKELIAYANNKKIRFINGAPDEKLVTTYKRLYMLSANARHQTQVHRLLAQA